jgi:hypothetical protein
MTIFLFVPRNGGLLFDERRGFDYYSRVGRIVTCMGTSDTNLSRVFPRQVINVDTWIWGSGFILHLCNLVATLHESHINYFWYDTRTRSSKYVCLLCSQLLHWLTSPISDLWFLWLLTLLFWLLIAYHPGLYSSPGCYWFFIALWTSDSLPWLV